MSDPRTDKSAGDDEALAELLRAAGPRPAVDPRRLEAVKSAVRPAWRRSVERRELERRSLRRRRALRWALPLAAVLALAVVWSWQPDEVPPTTLATVERLLGDEVRVLHTDTPEPLEVGTTLEAGDTVETGGGGLAIRLADGSVLRLDSGTRLQLLAPGRVELLEGGVYVDTHPEGPPPMGTVPRSGVVAIETRWGTATDVGTQFEVRIEAERLRIRVREGRVELARENDRQEISAGRQLDVDPSGAATWSEVASHGEPWAWVVELAPTFLLEGRSVADFLRWVARETGSQVRWHDAELATLAETSTAHGSLDGLDPVTALEVVPPASGLNAELVDDELLVTAAEAP